MIDNKSVPSDGELLSAIQTGDEPTRRDAKEKLFKKYAERLKIIITKYLHRKHCKKPRVHAEDVCSAVWINVFRNLDKVRESEKFDRWLLKVGWNEVHHHLTHCILEEDEVELTDESLRPLAQLTNYSRVGEAAIDADRILNYAASISEDLPSILRLRFLYGLSFAEIGTRLGISTVNVRNLYYRGLIRIRAKFDKEDTDTATESTGRTKLREGEES